jgi:TatA/E family protein of Tat protein translocase
MLSLPHLVVLFVIALVIFGPEKLPELARKLGKATAEFRKMSNDFRYALENEVTEMDRQARIREAEVASALSPVQPPPPPPEGTLSRDVPAPVAAAQPESVQTTLNGAPHADAEPSHATADAVTTPQEKPPDDNPAV